MGNRTNQRFVFTTTLFPLRNRAGSSSSTSFLSSSSSISPTSYGFQSFELWGMTYAMITLGTLFKEALTQLETIQLETLSSVVWKLYTVMLFVAWIKLKRHWSVFLGGLCGVISLNPQVSKDHRQTVKLYFLLDYTSKSVHYAHYQVILSPTSTVACTLILAYYFSVNLLVSMHWRFFSI